MTAEFMHPRSCICTDCAPTPTPPAPPENLTITLELPRLGKPFAYSYGCDGSGRWWWARMEDGSLTGDHYKWSHLLAWIAESERRQVRFAIDNAAAMFADRIRATHVELGMTLDEIGRDAQEIAQLAAWLARHAEALAEIEMWAVAL